MISARCAAGSSAGRWRCIWPCVPSSKNGTSISRRTWASWLAIQRPDAKTVLGDFSGRTFEHQGVATRFFKRNGDYMVHTDGSDGRLADFKVPRYVVLLDEPLPRMASGKIAKRELRDTYADVPDTHRKVR